MPNALPFFLRLSARICTVFLAGIYFLMIAGEFGSRHSAFPNEFREWAGILLLTACIAGMVVAWRHELTGAVLSLATLIGFALVVQFHNYALLAIVSLPGLLYIADWALRNHTPRQHA